MLLLNPVLTLFLIRKYVYVVIYDSYEVIDLVFRVYVPVSFRTSYDNIYPRVPLFFTSKRCLDLYVVSFPASYFRYSKVERFRIDRLKNRPSVRKQRSLSE